MKSFNKKLWSIICTMTVLFTTTLTTFNAYEVQAGNEQKPYTVILEPKLEYDNIFYNSGSTDIEKNYIRVYNKVTNSRYVEGLTDLKGKEIVPCKYDYINILNNGKILVHDMEMNWYMYDNSGKLLYSYGKYESITLYEKDKNLLRADMLNENQEYYGYRILKYNGEVIKEVIKEVIENDDNNDDNNDDETKVEYTGKVKYDRLELLENGKYFMAFNTEKIKDDGEWYEKDHAYLIKPDGTIISDLGYIGYYDDCNTVISFETIDKNKSGYDEEGYWHSYWIKTFVNMQGKMETIEYEEGGSSMGHYGENNGCHLGKYDGKLVFIEFPSLKKTTINPGTQISRYYLPLWDNEIYVHGENNKWYRYNFKGNLLNTVTFNSSQEITIEYWEENWMFIEEELDETSSVYRLMNKNGKIIKSYNKGNGLSSYWNDDEFLYCGIHGYDNEDKFDLINGKTGEIVCENIDDFDTSDINQNIHGYVNNNGIWSVLKKDKTQIQLGEFEYIFEDYEDQSNIIIITGITDYVSYTFLLNTDGKLIVDKAQKAWSTDYDPNTYIVKKNGQWLIIRSDGKIINNFGKVDMVGSSYGGFLFAGNNQTDYYDTVTVYKKGNIYNAQGKLLIKDADLLSSRFSHDKKIMKDKAIIKDNKGIWKEIDQEGKTLAEYGKYEHMVLSSEGQVIAFEKLGNNGYYTETTYTNPTVLNKDGTILIKKGQIEEIGCIGDDGGYVTVKVKGKWGIYKLNTAFTSPSNNKPVVNKPVVKKPVVKPVKIKQSMSVKAKTKKVKLKKVKKKKQIVSKAIVLKNAKGKVSYKKVKKGSSSKLTINKKTGKITVKKGTKKGTYKIKVKVTAKGNSKYLSASKTITVKIKVK